MMTSVTTNDTGAAVTMASTSSTHHASAKAASCLGLTVILILCSGPQEMLFLLPEEKLVLINAFTAFIHGPISNWYHIHPTSGA